MRLFYIKFKNLQSLPANLSWTSLCEILPIKEETKRNYYINISTKHNLSYRELRNKIKNNEYERLGFIDKENIKLNEENNKVSDLIKNPILIKNKGDEKITEYILKQSILEDIESFLKELGEGFSFVGSEYKIKIGNDYNYIDLLLFNYKFNCFVVIELKITSFKAEYIGQIKKYMNYIDKNIRNFNQDKTVGVIICKRENKFVLEYVSERRIFTTTYELVC